MSDVIRRFLMLGVSVMFGVASCSSSTGSSGSTLPAEQAASGALGAEAFCDVYDSISGRQPEEYVGSARHVDDAARLVAVAPPAIHPDLVVFSDFLLSGAIDSEVDPGSTETSNWPDDVQDAIRTVQRFATNSC